MKPNIRIDDDERGTDHPAVRLAEHLNNTEISDEAISALGELRNA